MRDPFEEAKKEFDADVLAYERAQRSSLIKFGAFVILIGVFAFSMLAVSFFVVGS